MIDFDDDDHSLEAPTWRSILTVYAGLAVFIGLFLYFG